MFTKALNNESTPESLKAFMRENRKKAAEIFEVLYNTLEEKDEEILGISKEEWSS